MPLSGSDILNMKNQGITTNIPTIVLSALLFAAIITSCAPPPGTEFVGMQSIRRSTSSGSGNLGITRERAVSDKGFSSGSSASRRSIIRTAKGCIGVPYRLGGVSKSGFDCSGLVLYAYKKNGVSLPRTSGTQFSKGHRISFKKARPGDLVFFRTGGSSVSHVGIYLGNYRFIHAPSTGKKVSVASLQNSYWKNKYAGTVSYLK